jgi:hypothetical protein
MRTHFTRLFVALVILSTTAIFGVPAKAAVLCGPWCTGNGGPQGRFGAQMAFDPGARLTVLFGGCVKLTSTSETITLTDGTTKMLTQGRCAPTDNLNDVWTYDGATNSWLPITPSGTAPFARRQGAMSYDYVSHSLILFGGLYDTNTTTAPPSADASLCFGAGADGIAGVSSVVDSSTGTTLSSYCFNDTWQLKYASGSWTWTKLNPTSRPTTRFDIAMTYDRNGHPTMVGGCHQMGMVGAHGFPTTPTYWDCNDYPAFGTHEPEHTETWQLTWIGSTPSWTWAGCSVQEPEGHDPCAPNEIRGASVAFDGASRQIVMYGGYYYTPTSSYNGYQGDTWVFDGTQWVRKERTGAHDQFCPRLQPLTAWSVMAPIWLTNKWQVLHYGGLGKYGSQTTCDPTADLSVQVSQKSYRWDSTNCVTVYNSSFSPTDYVCWWNETHETPGPHFAASAAYDFVNGKLVLFGGLTCLTCTDGSPLTYYYATSPTPDPCGC